MCFRPSFLPGCVALSLVVAILSFAFLRVAVSEESKLSVSMASTTMCPPRTSIAMEGSCGLPQICSAFAGGQPHNWLSSSTSCHDGSRGARCSCSFCSASRTSCSAAPSSLACAEAISCCWRSISSSASSAARSVMRLACSSAVSSPWSVRDGTPTMASASARDRLAPFRRPSAVWRVARPCILYKILAECSAAMSRAARTQPWRPVAARAASVSGRGGRWMPGSGAARPASFAISSASLLASIGSPTSCSFVEDTNLPA
mmetsp:Transcript_22907/g.58426  ORF Transcript_22907/g.58426 Transcript_22907/m.58426 type:complete len:260 (+) Transcript_22907:1404-2183(+)